MTITIEIPPEVEPGLNTQAAAHGLSPDEYRRFLLERFTLIETAPTSAPGTTRVFKKQANVWVLRTGQPFDPAVIDATLGAIREERDFATLGLLR